MSAISAVSVSSVQLARIVHGAVVLIIRRSWVRAPPAPPEVEENVGDALALISVTRRCALTLINRFGRTVADANSYRFLIHDVHWRFTWFQGQPGSGEAPLDEAGPVLDLLQAVPDDLDEVAEAGDGEVGQHTAFEH